MYQLDQSLLLIVQLKTIAWLLTQTIITIRLLKKNEYNEIKCF